MGDLSENWVSTERAIGRKGMVNFGGGCWEMIGKRPETGHHFCFIPTTSTCCVFSATLRWKWNVAVIEATAPKD